MNAIQLVARTDDTVTLRVADFEALLRAVEDAEDTAALLAAGARERTIGKTEARADHLSIDSVERLLAGESAIAIWREHRGLSSAALAEAAGIAPGDLTGFEAGRETPSVADYRALARALRTSLDDLVA